MYVRTFVWAEDQELGGDGWRPQHIQQFNTGFGMVVAHDTLEHFDAKDDSIEAEFMAFGSILYIRAEGGYWGCKGFHRTDASYQMNNEVTRFLDNVRCRIRSPGRTKRLNGYIEDIIAETHAECIKNYYTENVDASLDDYKRALTHAFGWMRKGYRKAVRRWGDVSAFARTNFFINLEREVDERHKYGEFGEALRVSVSPKTLTYKIKRVEVPIEY